MDSPRVLALALLVVTVVTACPRRPSADLQFDEPSSEPAPATEFDARITGLCSHAFAVLASESPSLRSPAIERDFVDECIASNLTKRSELGESRWTERAACIERAKTGVEIGLCDGRTPRVEPTPQLSPALDGRAICTHLFGLMLSENPDMKDVFGPNLDTLVAECAVTVETQRTADPVGFDREMGCLMSATTVADLDACNVD